MKKHFTLLVLATLSTGVGVRLAHAAAGDIYNLGTLGGTGSIGTAINASGQVAGFSNVTGDSAAHAFRYTGTPGSGGAMADLGTLGGTYSFGSGINASGQVAGYSNPTGDSAYHAFRYTGTPGAGGAMADLGSLGGTDFESIGTAINASGQVAGYSSTHGSSIPHAFLYTGTPGSGGAMADLGTLSETESKGSAINDSGQVAGNSHVTGNVAQHAFRYTGTPGSGGAMADLGTLGGGYSYGYAINDSGQVAGYSNTTGDSAYHAFLYTGTPGVDGVMTDLDTWLDANNPTEGAKWTLTDARGLNDAGLITGEGVYDDGPGGLSDGGRAYILDASSLMELAPGDLDLDGDVDFDDIDEFVLGLSNPQQYEDIFGVSPSLRGDTDDDGDLDFDDIDNFVAILSAPASTGLQSVPEPSAAALLCVGAGLLVLCMRRHRTCSSALRFSG